MTKVTGFGASGPSPLATSYIVQSPRGDHAPYHRNTHRMENSGRPNGTARAGGPCFGQKVGSRKRDPAVEPRRIRGGLRSTSSCEHFRGYGGWPESWEMRRPQEARTIEIDVGRLRQHIIPLPPPTESRFPKTGHGTKILLKDLIAEKDRAVVMKRRKLRGQAIVRGAVRGTAQIRNYGVSLVGDFLVKNAVEFGVIEPQPHMAAQGEIPGATNGG